LEVTAVDAEQKKYLQTLMGQDRGMANRSIANALRNAPNDSDAWHLMGVLLFRQNKFSESAEHFKRAVSLNQQDAASFFYLGLTSERLNKIPDAIQAYQTAYMLKPSEQSRENIVRLTKRDPAKSAPVRQNISAAGQSWPPPRMQVRHGHIDPNLIYYQPGRPPRTPNNSPARQNSPFAKAFFIVFFAIIVIGLVGGGLALFNAVNQSNEDRKAECQRIEQVFGPDRLPPDCRRILHGP
jgi:tetratricopeptide (TPR) repeat protein